MPASSGRAVNIVGLDLLIAKLTRIGYTLENGMGAPMRDSQEVLKTNTPPYPPPPPGSTYVRTYKLRDSIHYSVQPLGSTVVMTMSVGVEYGPYVVGEKTQARIHKGRWWTVEKVVRDSRNDIVRVFEEWVRKFMR